MKKDVVIEGKGKSLPAYSVMPDDGEKHPAVILIHEVWGLNEHIKDVAGRLSREGFAVLAPDLLSETGIQEKVDRKLMEDVYNPETKAEAQKNLRALMTPLNSPDFAKATLQKLQDCFNYLKEHESTTGKVAVMGFCFGGTYSFSLACHQKDLAVAIVFYGHAPDDELIPFISCPVYAFYGQNDKALVEPLYKFSCTLKTLGKDFHYIIYPDAAHAFFNDTNPYSYREKPAIDAWGHALKALKKYLI